MTPRPALSGGLLCLLACIVPAPAAEEKIHALLSRNAPYVSLGDADFRALGAAFSLPDGGRQVEALAAAAPGGAFDPRALHSLAPASLGYRADWLVERFSRYGLDWDIAGLRLASLDPGAARLPWVVIINGGAANVYEFFVDLRNRAGWGQYLAQRLNVLIVTIPGNFRYGGWDEPIESERRQPAYLLDRDLPLPESELRNAIMTNAVVFQGLKALVQKHTSGPILLVGHSTSGELAFLANDDPEMAARLEGRFLGWGSGGPARLDAIRAEKEPEKIRRGGSGGEGSSRTPLHVLSRRDARGYGRTYSRFLNPLYEPGMSTTEIAEKWLAAEARRRPNFKQQLQSIEHGDRLAWKGWIEVSIEQLLSRPGSPSGVNLEDISKDLFSSCYTRMDGYRRMVWTVAHYDRNHWVPEDPSASVELFIANEYRRKNPGAEIRVIVWDPLMTHYGHLELPHPLAGATFEVVRWLAR